MESMSMTDRVLRRSNRLASRRYSPYTSGTHDQKEKQKAEAVELGVELSLFLAEAMIILSDDMSSTLWFGHWLSKDVGKHDYNGSVAGRLFRVFLYVFTTYIKPKVGVGGVSYDQPGGDSVQCHELITSSSQDFAFLDKSLGRIVSILKNGGIVKSCSFEKWFLKKLDESLRSAKHVTGTDGFSRETIKSKVLPMWTSLFEANPKLINPQSSLTR